jgi:hypothetical protein
VASAGTRAASIGGPSAGRPAGATSLACGRKTIRDSRGAGFGAAAAAAAGWARTGPAQAAISPARMAARALAPEDRHWAQNDSDSCETWATVMVGLGIGGGWPAVAAMAVR